MFSFSGSGGVDKTERKNRERVFFWRECKMKIKKLKYKKKKKKNGVWRGRRSVLQGHDGEEERKRRLPSSKKLSRRGPRVSHPTFDAVILASCTNLPGNSETG